MKRFKEMRKLINEAISQEDILRYSDGPNSRLVISKVPDDRECCDDDTYGDDVDEQLEMIKDIAQHLLLILADSSDSMKDWHKEEIQGIFQALSGVLVSVQNYDMAKHNPISAESDIDDEDDTPDYILAFNNDEDDEDIKSKQDASQEWMRGLMDALRMSRNENI